MKRSTRMLLAQETVAICDAGFYETSKGQRVNIANKIAKAKEGTMLYTPEKPPVAHEVEAKRQTLFEARNETANSKQVEPTLRRRAELVLEIAMAHQVDQLVLGAWGCGVFRNDPRAVARIFADMLQPGGRFAGAFAKVAFAVFDRSEGETTYRAFAERIN